MFVRRILADFNSVGVMAPLGASCHTTSLLVVLMCARHDARTEFTYGMVGSRRKIPQPAVAGRKVTPTGQGLVPVMGRLKEA